MTVSHILSCFTQHSKTQTSLNVLQTLLHFVFYVHWLHLLSSIINSLIMDVEDLSPSWQITFVFGWYGDFYVYCWHAIFFFLDISAGIIVGVVIRCTDLCMKGHGWQEMDGTGVWSAHMDAASNNRTRNKQVCWSFCTGACVLSKYQTKLQIMTGNLLYWVWQNWKSLVEKTCESWQTAIVNINDTICSVQNTSWAQHQVVMYVDCEMITRLNLTFLPRWSPFVWDGPKLHSVYLA